MAKKKTKKQPAQAADAVRSAVDQAFQAGQAQFTRERASELVDDLAQAAGRLREALDDLRPIGAEDIKALSDKLDKLEARVAKLEKPAAAPRRSTAKRTTTRSTASKSPAKSTTRTAAKRTTRSAAKKTTTARKAS